MPNIKNPAIRERNCQLFYGCSEAEALSLNGGLPLRNFQSPASRYFNQRAKAAVRGVGWEITFPEWLDVWLSSGKFAQRGRGKSCYCMARHGDKGPYKVGNVSIQPNEKNSGDGSLLGWALSPRSHAGSSGRYTGQNLGTGRGWTLRNNTRKRPYQVVVGRTYVGVFATEQEAEAAYREAVNAEKHRLSLQFVE